MLAFVWDLVTRVAVVFDPGVRCPSLDAGDPPFEGAVTSVCELPACTEADAARLAWLVAVGS